MQRDRLFVSEMIEAAECIIALISHTDVETLKRDKMPASAALWNFTVLGEASSQLTPEVKQKHPEVNWSASKRLRNFIVHAYWTIDFDRLKATATDDLPPYIEQLRAVLADLETSG